MAKNTPRKKRKQRASKDPGRFIRENQKILDYVRLHPQDTVAQLASGVRSSYAVTQKKLNKLADLGALQRRHEVNLDVLGFENRYRIDVKVDHAELKKHYTGESNQQERLAKDLMKLNEDERITDVIVEDAAVLMGDPADLSLVVRTRGNQRVIFEFVTAKVRPMDGVESTSTCIEAWSISQERRRKQEADALEHTKQQLQIAAEKRRLKRLEKKNPSKQAEKGATTKLADS